MVVVMLVMLVSPPTGAGGGCSSCLLDLSQLGGREGWTKVEIVVKALGSLESLLIIIQIHRHFLVSLSIETSLGSALFERKERKGMNGGCVGRK